MDFRLDSLLQITFSFGVTWYLLIYVRRSLDELKDAITELTIALGKKTGEVEGR